MSSAKKIIWDDKGIEDVLGSLVRSLQEKGSDNLKLVGIHTRGISLAKRLAKMLNQDPDQIGTLDISLYRDDLSTVADMPILRETKTPFNVQGAKILLVDDVLFTGRTIRSAMDALVDLGRPKKIELLVLIDRGGREFPIQPDYCGKKIDVGPDEKVKVHLEEVDGVDEVIIVPKEA